MIDRKYKAGKIGEVSILNVVITEELTEKVTSEKKPMVRGKATRISRKKAEEIANVQSLKMEE